MRRSRSALAGLVVLAACAPPPRVADAPAGFRVPSSLRVQIASEAGRRAVTRVPLEAYVGAAILSEFVPSAGDRAAITRMYEVQAIVSRTYAVAHLGRHAREGFDLCSTTHCQVYEPSRLRTSRWAGTARDAAARTAGTVLWFGRTPAATVYHADCGGHTSDASQVWDSTGSDYLRGVRDDGPAAGAHAAWEFRASLEAVRQALNAYTPTVVGGRLDVITVVERDAAGRMRRLRLGGQVERDVRGEDFRAAMTRAFGVRSVRSTRATVTVRAGAVLIAGTGFGHGVGLCQAGAFARVRAGASPRAVLARYYPGTRLLSAR